MYKLITILYIVFHLGYFLKKQIKSGFICGHLFIIKNKGRLNINDNCVFRNFCTILIGNSANLYIGDSCFFNNMCSINCIQSIKIGNSCLFGENVKIYDHNHDYKSNSPIKDAPLISKPIVMGNNNWVGSNVVILAGVTIGNNCVIGANSVVYKNLPDNTLLFCNGESKKIRDIIK